MLNPWELPASPIRYVPPRVPAPDFSVIRVPSRTKYLPVYAAITFRAVGTAATGDSPASLTPGAPAGNTSTDVVLMVFMYQGGTVPTFTPPAGWTLAKRTDSSATYGCAVYRGLGSATFGAWTIGSAAGAMVGFSVGYVGVDTTTPMDATAVGQTNASSATVTAPSITTVTANAMIVGLFGWYSGTGAAAPTWSGLFGSDRGAKSFVGAGVPDTVAVEVVDAVQAVAGASGAKTATASAASTNVGTLVALRPAAAAAGPVMAPDFPNPRSRDQSITLRTWTQGPAGGPIGNGSAHQQYDYPNPRSREYPSDLRTWTQSSPPAIPPAAPVNQYDWPIPRSREYSIQLRSWTQGPAGGPIGNGSAHQQYEFPNPRGYDYSPALRTWIATIAPITAATTQPPAIVEWANPRARDFPLHLRTWVQSGTPPIIPPTAQYDWPNPRVREASTSLRTWTQAGTSPVISPARPFDWQNPKVVVFSNALRSWVQSTPPTVTVAAARVVPSDFPNPRQREFPAVLRSWIQSRIGAPIAATKATAQYDWPVPRGRDYAIGLRTWISQVVQLAPLRFMRRTEQTSTASAHRVEMGTAEQQAIAQAQKKSP